MCSLVGTTKKYDPFNLINFWNHLDQLTTQPEDQLNTHAHTLGVNILWLGIAISSFAPDVLFCVSTMQKCVR